MTDMPVVMDCDPGWDDALALTLLAADYSRNVLGITTVYGNGTLENSTRNARHLTAFLNVRYLTTYEGLSGPLPYNGPPPAASAAQPCRVVQDMGELGPHGDQIAYAFLISAARTHGSRLTILATAPLTNIAVAIQKNPDVMKQIGGIVIVGGAFKGGGSDEFNLSRDPTATDIVLSAGINVYLIPFETCQQLTNTVVVSKVSARGKPLDIFYVAVVDDQLAQDNPEAKTGLYDAVGALFVLNRDLFDVEAARVTIDPAYQGTIVRMRAHEPGYDLYLVSVKDVPAAYQLVYNRLAIR